MNCGTPNWLRILPTETNYALISSTLLTSFMQGKPVKLWLSGCHADGSVKFHAAWIDK